MDREVYFHWNLNSEPTFVANLGAVSIREFGYEIVTAGGARSVLDFLLHSVHFTVSNVLLDDTRKQYRLLIDEPNMTSQPLDI